MTANLITEIFGYKADVSVCGDTVALKTNFPEDEILSKLYSGLQMQIKEISGEFNGTIKLKFTEV